MVSDYEVVWQKIYGNMESASLKHSKTAVNDLNEWLKL